MVKKIFADFRILRQLSWFSSFICCISYHRKSFALLPTPVIWFWLAHLIFSVSSPADRNVPSDETGDGGDASVWEYRSEEKSLHLWEGSWEVLNPFICLPFVKKIWILLTLLLLSAFGSSVFFSFQAAGWKPFSVWTVCTQPFRARFSSSWRRYGFISSSALREE